MPTPDVRVDRASMVVGAAPDVVFAAFTDGGTVARWLPPDSMRGRALAYDFTVGGSYALELTYDDATPGAPGKTTTRSDLSRGRFLVIEPGRRLVQSVVFESDDAAFAGEMRLSWTFRAVDGGTEVTVEATQVPRGISPEDHAAGFSATLANLATFVAGS